MRVSLMITCLGDVVRPAAGQATVTLLRRLGHTVDFPAAQTCCGQPFYNSGFAELARQQARHTIGAFADSEVVVTPSGSCAAMIRAEYPHLLANDPAWHGRAVELAGRTFELAEFLVRRLGVVDVGARFAGRVTYHEACHLRMLAATDEVERLLGRVEGLTYVPLVRREQCCGFGGSFSVRYGEISGAMVEDKVRCILDGDVDAVVSTDTGCLMNIGGRLHRRGCASRPRVMHLAELLESR